MEARTICERKAGGHTVEVIAEIGAHGPELTAYIGGRYEACVSALNYNVPAQGKAKGYVAMVGRVGLTAAEVTAAESALTELRVAYEADPAVIYHRLKEQRQALIDAVTGLQQREQDDREAAWEYENETRAVATPVAVTDRIAAARQALRDFDAAHPDFLAELQGVEVAFVERHAGD